MRRELRLCKRFCDYDDEGDYGDLVGRRSPVGEEDWMRLAQERLHWCQLVGIERFKHAQAVGCPTIPENWGDKYNTSFHFDVPSNLIIMMIA